MREFSSNIPPGNIAFSLESGVVARRSACKVIQSGVTLGKLLRSSDMPKVEQAVRSNHFVDPFVEIGII